VDFLQLMRFVCHDLGIKEQVEGRFDAIRVISDYLLEQSEKKNSVLVVIDEAQNLSVETLEELRMLSNLEAYNQKLLQIVLAGQPELVEKLERQELRQLNQRIAIRFRLGVLDAEETAQYVQHRLHVADCSAQLFDAAALKLIHKTSQGVPRLINQLCSAGLLRAMTMGKKRVRLEVMQEVLANECASIARRSPARIQIERTGGPRWLWPAISLCLLAVLLMVLLRPVREPAQPVAVIQQQAQSASAVETAQRGEMSAVSVALDTLRAEVETVIQEPATRQA
jgi:general secretion pathway protein A